ncbi:4-hydroxyphenylpyruvate dioxygenase [Streptomyces fuscichromogenes]|uniref:4-hydroxyphenylpyruvate dioxygenase n=1 Tax=Streptomyces fuscichromogenes TaxID=1324013 RepID=UPI003812AFF3
MDIGAIDHLECYVADAESSADFFRDAFGFRICGRGGPETGQPGCRSVLLRQGGIRLLVTSALGADHPVADYVRRHGDGVAVIAVVSGDAHAAFTEAVARGAAAVEPPVRLGGEGTRVTFASVAGFGDVAQRFVERDAADGPFAPGRIVDETPRDTAPGLLTDIDHIAVCVPAGELDRTVDHYRSVFDFTQIFDERIIVGDQAMDSKVVQSESGGLTLTILEPDITKKPGQIDEFVRLHDGAGVQHVAFRTDDISAAVREFSERGVRFLSTPSGYYDVLTERLGALAVPVDELRELNILADRDHWGLMLQIFTASRHPRQTLFYELIDRRGGRTFGSNNIKALYEAVDRQHAAGREPRY